MKKPLTLKEAQTPAKLDQFIEQHPSTGDMEEFEKALASIVGKPKKKPATPRS